MENKELPQDLAEQRQIIMGDAFYLPGISNNDYHASSGVSSSIIRKFGRSQLHALREEVEKTPALRFGSAAHSYIVEGENVFNNEVACISGSPYTNANKQLRADYEARGLTVITVEERDRIIDMSNSLLPEAYKMLNPDEGDYPGAFESPYEQAIYWYEKGLLLKVKSDVIRKPLNHPHASNSVILIDYKTTADCSPKGFTSSIYKFDYHLQAAWYKRAYERAGLKVEGFAFVAQEKKIPYASKIFWISNADMDKGWVYLDRLITEYKAVVNGASPTIYNTPHQVNIDIVWRKENG